MNQVNNEPSSISGGYKTQTVIQLGNLLSIYNEKKIGLRAMRVYLACLVITASREAAKRLEEKNRPSWKNKKNVTPMFLFEELTSLTGLTKSQVKKELKSLERAGLLLFSESSIQFTKSQLPTATETTEALAGKRSIKRPIPLPRRVLRFLVKEGREGSIKTTLAYIVRGLAISRKGEIKYKGTVKACWISEVTGLSLRSVRTARKELIGLEFITDDEGSKQWKLNRDGAYFTINLDWTEPRCETIPVLEKSNSARPTLENCTHFAPPYKDKKTLNRSKNQKTHTSGEESALRALSGFCEMNLKKETFTERRTIHKQLSTKKIRKPILRDIKPDDLKRLSKLKMLYAQATKAKWLEPSEANFQNFVSAAVRATRTEGDSVRIFVSIVKKGLWKNITQAQEDRAREVIQKSRNKKLELALQDSSYLSKFDIFSLVS